MKLPGKQESQQKNKVVAEAVLVVAIAACEGLGVKLVLAIAAVVGLGVAGVAVVVAVVALAALAAAAAGRAGLGLGLGNAICEAKVGMQSCKLPRIQRAKEVWPECRERTGGDRVPLVRVAESLWTPIDKEAV